MFNEMKLPCLSLSEFTNDTVKKYLKVFTHPCLITSPFTPQMNSRLVAYNEKLSVDVGFLEPIISAAKSMGDTGFYFSFVDVYDYQIDYPGLSGKEEYLKSWFIPFDQVNEYLAQTFLTNHVIYSQQGKWGAFVSVDHFLLLGGTADFISRLNISSIDLNQALEIFIDIWKEWNVFLGYELKWIPKLLEHVYGVDEARRLIQKNKLEPLV